MSIDKVKATLDSAAAAGGSLNRAKLIKDAGETITNMARGTKDFIGKAFKFAFNPKLLKVGSKIPGHLGLIVGAGAIVAGVTAFAMSMRTGAEASNALRMKGNHHGSIWWSSAQTGLHGLTIASIAGLGLMAPAFICAFPLLPLIPSAGALGMDYFQELSTNPNSWLNRLGQFGLDNALVETKNSKGMFVTYLPKTMNFWNEKIRAKDEIFAKKFFGVDLDRPEIGLAQSNPNFFVA